MTEVLHRRFGNHVPDILDCLAQLSNDQVPTPPKVARAMLDILPLHVWRQPSYRWLDPCCKSGVFLREIASRLLTGLEEWEPDFDKRREHIYRNMLFGTSITQITGMISRRSLYCARDASSELSAVRFDNPDGNLPFVPAPHRFVRGRCAVCGAPESLEREGRENYAYSFIHNANIPKGMQDMKFDIVVSNPPYQLSTEGYGATASTIYHRFVEKAISMNPRYLLMITPSRWFAGGKGLDEFRDKMIADRHLAKLVDNPKLFDCFPGVEIKGGVSYFLWDREHDGDCAFSTRIDGVVVSTALRDLRAGDGVVMRDNRAVSIVEKVRAKDKTSVETACTVTKPFGLTMRSNYPGSVPEPFEGAIPLIYSNRIGYSRPDQIQRNHQWIDQWKVLLPMAGDGHGREVSYVLGEPIAVAPGSACTQTYFIPGMFDTRDETENFAYYLATKFVRFLVLQRKVTQHVTPDRFRFVPMLDMKRRWTDEELYDEFGLTEDERGYIDRTIHPREPILSLDSAIPASHLPGGVKYRVADEGTSEDEE
ncbi:Eco57I restriction-modification methylase domain-containing protein [Mycolicibacter arupensis]|jgi:site-specific DNA-methyltransferase (adenine-specific)|uniref:Restriction endonuclease n=1 Tax=Mycolicibacter arupensis TaxID=342002 RepID=A0A5C7XWR6_9MYCO|nr:Eco57I restriction-modification methylase domain-containing protein [Mycolicibacter arupensis]TXI53997.1 MAG: restriction endonuclease [Mycolicibacter arupensis]